MLYAKIQFVCIKLSKTFFIAQIFAALVLGFDASRIYYSAGEKNETTPQSHDKKSGKETESVNVPALVGVIAQLIIIIVAVTLIVVAVLHRAKFRKILLIWIILTLAGLVISFVSLLVRVIVYKTSWIDVLITLAFAFYEGLCCWLVLSYYKLLAALGNHHEVGYDVFANENDFSTMEKSTTADD